MKQIFLKVLLLVAFVQIAHAQPALRFSITDGKTKDTVLSVTSTQKETVDNGVKVAQQLTDGNPQKWTTTITNVGGEERWVYLNWFATWDGSSNLDQLHYWSGTGNVHNGDELLNAPSSTVAQNTSMLQTIYDAQNGLALALDPFEIVSDLRQSLVKTDTGFELHLQIPLVLDAGKSDTFPVDIYRFAPRYGFLDALQKYYNAHPDAFSARQNIDPRAAGVGSTYTAWKSNSFELTRRFSGDWDWCYAPFKRTGDIYGRPQFWDYEPARPFPEWLAKMTPEEFRKDRQNKLKVGAAAGAAMMFFTPSYTYSEIELAKKQYPGAIIYRPDGKYASYYGRPWVTHHDNEVMVYPWGNEFAKQSLQDTEDIVKENPIAGFAFDVMSSEQSFRGTGMKESPRRAFNKDGEYVDLSVGVAKTMDFVRGLKKDGKELGIVGNPTGKSRTFLAARADSVIFEYPPYASNDQLIPLRYALGHKTITWWVGLERIVDKIDWQHMTPEEIRAAYLGAADYVKLASYRFGAFPPNRMTMGVPSLVQELPLLKEVITEGWQAVPAVRMEGGALPITIWSARYGNGVGSFITLGNINRTAWQGTIVIDNDYLGKDNYLFIDAKGQPVNQTVSGRTTKINVTIPSHETLVLRAVVAVSPSSNGAAEVSWNDNGAQGSLSIKSTFTPSQVIAPRSGWDAAGSQGQTWNFVSKYFSSATEAIRNFPYFGNGKNAVIVLPANPTAEETWAAEHIQGYFKFWGEKGMTPAKEISLSIVKGKHAQNNGQPVIYVSGEANKIHRDGNALHVGADEASSLKESTTQLLNTLDKKYFYTGVFPKVIKTKLDGEVMEKAGLKGGLLTR